MSDARWTERRIAMLREMGVQHFWPVSAEPETPPTQATATATAVAPAVVAGAMVSVADAAGAALPTRADALLGGESDGAQRVAGTVGTVGVTVGTPAAQRGAPRLPAAPPSIRPSGAPVTLGARPSGVETMDWPTLQGTVAGCQACGLCQGRRNTVFGVGNTRARWMLIGEAPGEQEDRQGEPFVGRAGQLLDRMLTAVGLTRQEAEAERQVYIANVIKCRPPGNRNPLPEEVAQCEPYLLRQVALVQPRLILAMGRFAVQSLLRSSEPIGRLRGRVHDYHGVPLVVTYHPAYLLRNPADKALAWDDLCLARELVESGR